MGTTGPKTKVGGAAQAPAETPELPKVPGYRMVRLLRAGGMGSVFVAERTTTHEPFAVKFLHKHLASDKASVARFDREIQTLRDIRHPNVVQVFAWSLPGADKAEKGYVVMELLHGETLQELLKRERLLPPRQAVSILLQILDGLAAAHALGVLHRDLGPSNVFLENRTDGSTRAKLIDFGLAHSFVDASGGSVTEPGTLMGKPAYVAPEAFCEEPAGEQADIFACGMILYRVAAGRLPFEATSSELLWVERFSERKTDAEYRSPLVFEPSLAPSLAEVISKAIRRRPGDRIASAREFQRLLLELEPTLSDEIPSTSLRRIAGSPTNIRPLSVGPTPSPRDLAASPRRRRTRLLVAGGAALLVVLGLLLWLVPWSRDRATKPPAESDLPSVAAAASSEDAGGPDPVPAADGAAGEIPVPTTTADGSGGGGAPVVEVGATGPAPITIALLDLPETAEVRWNGARVDRVPFQVPRGNTSVLLEVLVRGYLPFRRLVTPDRDVELAVALRPVRGARPPRDAGGADTGGAVVKGTTGAPMMTKFE